MIWLKILWILIIHTKIIIVKINAPVKFLRDQIEAAAYNFYTLRPNCTQILKKQETVSRFKRTCVQFGLCVQLLYAGVSGFWVMNLE